MLKRAPCRKLWQRSAEGWPRISRRPNDLGNLFSVHVEQTPASREICYRDDVWWADVEPVHPESSPLVVTLRFARVGQKVCAARFRLDDDGALLPEGDYVRLLATTRDRNLRGNDTKPLSPDPARPESDKLLMQVTWHGHVVLSRGLKKLRISASGCFRNTIA